MYLPEPGFSGYQAYSAKNQKKIYPFSRVEIPAKHRLPTKELIFKPGVHKKVFSFYNGTKDWSRDIFTAV